MHASSNERRTGAAEFSIVDIAAAMGRAQNADRGANGRIATPLLKLPGLRIVLVSMAAGATWPEHATAGRITVQPLAGEIRMRAEEREIALRPGHVAAFAAGVSHDVTAVTDAMFLLTVARPSLD
jgi:quercetin dioxygenase-like cupin family protein